MSEAIHLKSALKHICVIYLVLISYAFFTYCGSQAHLADFLPKNYHYLTEGFLSGKLSFPFAPPLELSQLKNPYDFRENYNIQFPDGEFLHQKVHDASYYKGKLYLYFGPLPVFLFYLPSKLFLGYYLSDYVAIFLFLSLGFIFCYALLIKIQKTYFPHLSDFQIMLAGLSLGLANNAPFLCTRAAFYEVAIASAFFMLSAALFFLYRIFHDHFKIKDLIFFSLCLGLSASGRPHFALLSFILIPSLWIYLCKYTDKSQLLVRGIALSLPALFIGSFLMLYNTMRFDSIFEFGHNYELAANSGLSNHIVIDPFFNLLYEFYNYFLRSFDLINSFPYVFFPNFYEIRMVNDKAYEATVGFFKISPLLMFLFFLPFVIKFYSRHESIFYRPLLHFIKFFVLMTGIIVLFILSIKGSNYRYLSDFSTFLVELTIISFWLCEKYVRKDVYKFFEVIFVFLCLLSIYIGMILGVYYIFQWYYFVGYNFSKINEVMFFIFSFFLFFVITGLLFRKRMLFARII